MAAVNPLRVEVLVSPEEFKRVQEDDFMSAEGLKIVISMLQSTLQKMFDTEFVWAVDTCSQVEDWDSDDKGLSIENTRGDNLMVFIMRSDGTLKETPLLQLQVSEEGSYCPIFHVVYKDYEGKRSMWVEGIDTLSQRQMLEVKIPLLEEFFQKIVVRLKLRIAQNVDSVKLLEELAVTMGQKK